MFFFKHKQLFLEKLEITKGVISKMGCMFPIIYPTVMSDDDKLFVIDNPIMLMFETDEQRTESYNRAGMYCKKKNADGVILISDMRTRILEEVNSEKLKYLVENFETERPSLYPDSMIQTNIVLNYVDFEKQKNLLTLTCKHNKDEDNNIKFEKYKVLENIIVVENIIQPLLKGWNDYFPGCNINGLLEP